MGKQTTQKKKRQNKQKPPFTGGREERPRQPSRLLALARRAEPVVADLAPIGGLLSGLLRLVLLILHVVLLVELLVELFVELLVELLLLELLLVTLLSTVATVRLRARVVTGATLDAKLFLELDVEGSETSLADVQMVDVTARQTDEPAGKSAGIVAPEGREGSEDHLQFPQSVIVPERRLGCDLPKESCTRLL
jgi:hypothetical protein